MAVTIVEHDGGRMIDFGDRARVERRFRPEQEPVTDPKMGTPVIDPLTKQPVTKDVLGPDGNPVFVWVAYEKVEATPNDSGKLVHPVHGDATTHEYVWVIRGQGTEADPWWWGRAGSRGRQSGIAGGGRTGTLDAGWHLASPTLNASIQMNFAPIVPGAEITERKQRRRRPFAPGTTGNPAGRPRGARNRATLAAEALLEGRSRGGHAQSD